MTLLAGPTPGDSTKQRAGTINLLSQPCTVDTVGMAYMSIDATDAQEQGIKVEDLIDSFLNKAYPGPDSENKVKHSTEGMSRHVYMYCNYSIMYIHLTQHTLVKKTTVCCCRVGMLN